MILLQVSQPPNRIIVAGGLLLSDLKEVVWIGHSAGSKEPPEALRREVESDFGSSKCRARRLHIPPSRPSRVCLFFSRN